MGARKALLLGLVTLTACGPTVAASPSLADDAARSSTAAPSALPSQAKATDAPSTPTPPPVGVWQFVDVGGAWIADIAESDTVLVAAGRTADGAPLVLHSADGVDWTPADLPPFEPADGATGSVDSVAAGAGGFVAAAASFEVPFGPAEPQLLHSVDGSVWQRIATEGEPVCVRSIQTGSWGYVAFGGACRGEGAFAPSPTQVLVSADAVNWTNLGEPDAFAGFFPQSLATDGQRLVAVGADAEQRAHRAWVSDDGQTWHMMPSAFPSNLTVYDLEWANGRFLASASQVIREGDPDTAACVSLDGEAWECRVLPRSIIGFDVTPTATGFVSIFSRLADPFAGENLSFVSRSFDGLEWRDAPLGRDRLIFQAARSTSRGLFVWGLTEPSGPANAQPFLIVHHGRLP